MPPGSVPPSRVTAEDGNATLFSPWLEDAHAQGQLSNGLKKTPSSTLPDLPMGSTQPAVQQLGATQPPGGNFHTMPQQPPANVQWQQSPPPQAMPPFQQQTVPAPARPSINQPVYPQGMAPASMHSNGAFGAAPRRRRGGRILWRLLLSLIILFAIFGGIWFFGVRPYIHELAQTQLDQALNEVETQVKILQLALPPGSQVLHISESTFNDYLKTHETSQLQDLHMTVMPEGLQLDFQAYGFSSTILAMPVARSNILQVENVRVQGVLGLVMSNDELTPILNQHLQAISGQAHRNVQKVTLQAHQIDIQIS